jgi:hypothetical protein
MPDLETLASLVVLQGLCDLVHLALHEIPVDPVHLGFLVLLVDLEYPVRLEVLVIHEVLVVQLPLFFFVC